MGRVGRADGIGDPAGTVAASALPGRAGVELQVVCDVEVSGYLVGSTAFKAAGTGDPRPAGSIPVHLRQSSLVTGPISSEIGPVVSITALDVVGYTGSLFIESFTAENETIAVAASIWRPLAPSRDRLATDGLVFLRNLRPTHASR